MLCDTFSNSAIMTLVVRCEVFTLPHVFRTIPMQNAMESDGVRANFCGVRVSPHGLAGAKWQGHLCTELGLRVESEHYIRTPHGLCCLIECTKIEHNQGLNSRSPDYHVTLSAQLTTLPNGLPIELCYLGNDHLLPTIYRGVFLLHIGCIPK